MGSRFGNVLTSIVIVLTFVHTEAKPFHHHEMDKVDVCIFTCDYCFKGDFLVACANECLAMDGVMGPLWMKTCPFFDKHPQTGVNSNTFK